MTLPKLPRVLKKKEADISPCVFKWFEQNYPKSVAIEIKVKGGRTKPHQTIALKQVDAGVFSHKMPDMGRRNPFDGFMLKNADAYVVTCDKGICEAVSPSGTRFTFDLSTCVN